MQGHGKEKKRKNVTDFSFTQISQKYDIEWTRSSILG
jgi:hypothetical protein